MKEDKPTHWTRKGCGNGMTIREQTQQLERQTLAPWAAFSSWLTRWSRAVIRWATRSGRSCWSRSSAGFTALLLMRTTSAGTPTAVQLAGRFFSTTLPAPTRALSPMYTGPSTLVPAPISTLSPRVGWRLPVSLPVPPRVTPW